MSTRAKSAIAAARQNPPKQVTVVRMDVGNEQRQEMVTNFVINAVQNVFTGNNYAVLGKHIRQHMDDNYGGPWHCLMGSDFACETSGSGQGSAHFMVDGYLSIVLFRTADARRK